MNTFVSSHAVTARWLLLISAVGITYGSLYPFDFVPKQVTLDQIALILMSDWQNELSIPNIFANIVLFIPYGLFGALAFPGATKGIRLFVVLSSAAILAFGIQVVQIWFPLRIPTVADGIINMGGVLIGITVAAFPPIRSALSGFGNKTQHTAALPFLLLLTWLAYRWLPFVPTLDIFMLTQGLKPLLLHMEWRPLNFIHNLVAWLVFAALWRQCCFRETLLWLIIPGSLLVQVFIADNPVLLHNIGAAAIAAPLWFILSNLFRRPELMVLSALVGLLFLMGLRPFEIGSSSSFKWLPFAGFLSGNMLVNTSSLLEKLFLYGSLVWLMLDISRSRLPSLLLPILITGTIEIAQIWLVGRGAEITDPILCLLIWLVAIRERGSTRPQRFLSDPSICAHDTTNGLNS